LIDLNLGCPQKIARRGNYGAFLLEKQETVLDILTHLVENSGTLISAKIRIFEDREDTFEYCQKLAKTGICMLTIHGRTRFQNKERIGDSDWPFIRRIKESLSIPVISNGSVREFKDVQKCLKETKCDGVMSAEGILENPSLFSGEELKDMDVIAKEYMEFVIKYPDQISYVKSHLFKLFHSGLKIHTDLRTRLGKGRTYEEFNGIVKEMGQRRKDMPLEDKLGWYKRYWKKTEIKPELAKKDDSDLKKEEATSENKDLKKIKLK
jgi:tRNA-dihydrouridine synthase